MRPVQRSFQTAMSVTEAFVAAKDAHQKNRPYFFAMVLGASLAAGGGTARASDGAIASIERYCTACWRNAHVPADRWGDCTQEVFRRLVERIPAEAWRLALDRDSEERLELVRAIDAVKKRHQRDRLRNASQVGELADGRWTDSQDRREEIERLQTAVGKLLTPRQQEIVRGTLEGLDVADLASRLQLPAQRISDEKYKAVQKLRSHFQNRSDWS